jgi:hypothetical protein
MPDDLRPLTEGERERIVQLFLRKKWRKLRKFAKQLDRNRVSPSPDAASTILAEWLVKELNRPDFVPEGLQDDLAPVMRLVTANAATHN